MGPRCISGQGWIQVRFGSDSGQVQDPGNVWGRLGMGSGQTRDGFGTSSGRVCDRFRTSSGQIRDVRDAFRPRLGHQGGKQINFCSRHRNTWEIMIAPFFDVGSLVKITTFFDVNWQITLTLPRSTCFGNYISPFWTIRMDSVQIRDGFGTGSKRI